jgi:transcription antitermination factor NusG
MVKKDEILTELDLVKNDNVLSHWYAAYTLPRHEKAVAGRLLKEEVEAYVPLYWAVRRWNLRRVKVELPLFPGYVFVRMLITDRVRVLAHPGVIRLVGSNGKAAALPDGEIETLRSTLAIYRAEPYPYLTAGKKIRIRSGPFAGLEGRIVRRKGTMRLVASIDLIQRSIVLELDAAEAQLAS